MRPWSRRDFLRLVPGIAGSALIPGVSLSPLASFADDRARGLPTAATDADLPPRTIALRTQGGAFRFDPIGLWMDPGSAVTWLNMGDFHTTTAFHPANSHLVGGGLPLRIPEGAEPWHSGMLGLDAGTQYERRLTVEGVYDYLCQPHYGFGMVGRLVVGRPRGGPAVTNSMSELPDAVRANLPPIEMVTGSRGRTFEWASRINGVLLLLANAQSAGAAAQAVAVGARADQQLSSVLDATNTAEAFDDTLGVFTDAVVNEAGYEHLVSLADRTKDTLDRARG